LTTYGLQVGVGGGGGGGEAFHSSVLNCLGG